jgi:hypothetical protein
MAGAASAHQAAAASREETGQQRADRTRRTSADPQRAQQGATAAAVAASAALDSLSRLQHLANASPQVAQLRRLQARADGRFAPVAQLAGGPEEEELVQGKFATAQLQPQLQQAPRANNTGLPDQLKSGIESLSGLSMDHVRVHYNSSQPAQLNALAYAQGSDIHLAPGQERHLPHEAWHVVQQAQGRVSPTMQMQEGVLVNDDTVLEREADVMGARAISVRAGEETTFRSAPIDFADSKITNKPLAQFNKDKGRRRGGAILKNNNINSYLSSDFVSLHVANSEEEAFTIARHRVGLGLDRCHVIDRISLPLVIAEIKSRNEDGYFEDVSNRVDGPATANQFLSACTPKIYEIEYTKKNGLKRKAKMLETRFYYDAPLFHGAHVLHHFDGVQ